VTNIMVVFTIESFKSSSKEDRTQFQLTNEVGASLKKWNMNLQGIGGFELNWISLLCFYRADLLHANYLLKFPCEEKRSNFFSFCSRKQ
jgi:hypothetical protein